MKTKIRELEDKYYDEGSHNWDVIRALLLYDILEELKELNKQKRAKGVRIR